MFADKDIARAREIMRPAIAQLKVNLETMLTNEPINRKEGDKAQADLEHSNAASYRTAIKELAQ